MKIPRKLSTTQQLFQNTFDNDNVFDNVFEHLPYFQKDFKILQMSPL